MSTPSSAAQGAALSAEPNKDARAPKEKGRGIIFAVGSGDTVSILPLSSPATATGPPPLRELTFSNLSAPKLGRKEGVRDEVSFLFYFPFFSPLFRFCTAVNSPRTLRGTAGKL